jgi:hypothetical protein
MSDVLCPRCLRPLEESHSSCPHDQCQIRLPFQYVRDCKLAPPIMLATFGFTQVGKTTHLAAMCLQLSELQRAAPAWGGTWFGANDLTRAFITEARRRSERGERVAPTQVKREPVMPYMLHGAFEEDARHRFVLLYDVPGEALTSTDALRELVPALPHIGCAWFYWQPNNTREVDEGHTLTNMFERYLDVMREAGTPSTRRRAILIGTCADEFQIGEDAFRTRVAQDPLARDENGNQRPGNQDVTYDEYLDDVRRNSAELTRYFALCYDYPDVQQFVSQAKYVRMSVECCLISSTGKPVHAANGDRYPHSWQRFRVLEPALLSFDTEASSRLPAVALLIDPLAAGKPEIAAQIASLSSILGQYGQVRRYNFGNTTAAETLETATRPRLVAPIIAKLPADVPAVLLCERAPLDLGDLRGIAEGRTLVVVADGSIAWPNLAHLSDLTTIPPAMQRMRDRLARRSTPHV